MAKICCFCLSKSQKRRQKTRPPPKIHSQTFLGLFGPFSRLGESSRGNTIRGNKTGSLWETKSACERVWKPLKNLWKPSQKPLKTSKNPSKISENPPSQRPSQRQISSQRLSVLLPLFCCPLNSFRETFGLLPRDRVSQVHGTSRLLREANPGGFQTQVFPTFFGNGPDCNCRGPLSGLFRVGALNRPRKRKRTNRENPRTIPEQIGKIPEKPGKSRKGQKMTKKSRSWNPLFETPPV